MYRVLLFSLACALQLGCSDAGEPPEAQQIVDRAQDVHGIDVLEGSKVDFDFRGVHFEVIHDDGLFSYKRTYSDTSGNIVEVLSNDGFTRTADGEPYEMTQREFNIWTEDVNSVVYFALLPHKLNDPAVNKNYLGVTEIGGESYHTVEITFDQEGGGRDYDDRFVYWFHKDEGTMDYLAYLYTQRGTARFREAFNVRTIRGLRIADYRNYRADEFAGRVEEAAVAFEKGELELLSEIRTEDVRVDPLGR